MPSTSTPAAPRHRLGIPALAGVVLIAGIAAYALHHGRGNPDIHHWTGVQMNGATSQRERIFAVERQGAVRAIYMTWRLRCRDGSSYVTGTQFREPLSTFQRRGRAFTVQARGVVRSGPARGQMTASVRGLLSESLRVAEGVAERTSVLRRSGGRTVECTSGVVRWRASLAAGSRPN